MKRLCRVCKAPTPVGDQSPACPKCWRDCVDQLDRLTGLLYELDVTLTRQSVTSTRNGSRSSVKPLAYNVAASETRDVVMRILRRWVDEPGVDRRSPRAMTRAIHRALPTHRLTDDGWQLIADIDDATKAILRAIDLAPDRWYAGPCGGIKLVDDVETTCVEELYAPPDAATIECRNCHTKWDVAVRRKYLLDVSRDHLVTTHEACRAISVYGAGNLTADTIRSWKARGRLLPHGTDHEGHDLWRLGDVEDLAVNRTTRKGTKR